MVDATVQQLAGPEVFYDKGPERGAQWHRPLLQPCSQQHLATEAQVKAHSLYSFLFSPAHAWAGSPTSAGATHWNLGQITAIITPGSWEEIKNKKITL